MLAGKLVRSNDWAGRLTFWLRNFQGRSKNNAFLVSLRRVPCFIWRLEVCFDFLNLFWLSLGNEVGVVNLDLVYLFFFVQKQRKVKSLFLDSLIFKQNCCSQSASVKLI